jgi:hypothetical protein
VYRGFSLRSNPGLQLANAFGVYWAAISERLRHYWLKFAFGVVIKRFERFMMRWLATRFRAKMICFFEDYDYLR